ncbi:hypothetical protein GYMLUDRAFT_101363 [Collybiopsis luxurians FD-317 M1]|uniref:Uncharacterized protein n=1 Tax=Collybiopsis luxurians FD-317 M1 TaxID=944289 RepID=A0A0D0BX68_9AGAR|nr:hypothetical protein GYMLUDRAFT_101363 [Collybiopsis luxurians FD-317 M1]
MAMDDDGRKQDVGIKRIPTLMTDGSEKHSAAIWAEFAQKFDNLLTETVDEGSAKVILLCPSLRLYRGLSYGARTTLNKELDVTSCICSRSGKAEL